MPQAIHYSQRQAAFEPLNEAARRQLMRLHVFTLEAARAIASATPRLLAQRTHKSLLRNEGMERYQLHEILRQFAGEMQAAHFPAELSNLREAAAHYGQAALTMAQEKKAHIDESYAWTIWGHALAGLNQLEAGLRNLRPEPWAGLAQVTLAQGDLHIGPLA